MALPKQKKQLVQLLKRLELPHPDSLADDILDRGPEPLLAALFVRRAWQSAIAPGNTEWIDRETQKGTVGAAKLAERFAKMFAERGLPAPPMPKGLSALGSALQRCREKGGMDEDLTTVARAVQGNLIFSLCYLLEDPNLQVPELEQSSWGLFRVDASGRPVEQLVGMHGAVFDLEPK